MMNLHIFYAVAKVGMCLNPAYIQTKHLSLGSVLDSRSLEIRIISFFFQKGSKGQSLLSKPRRWQWFWFPFRHQQSCYPLDCSPHVWETSTQLSSFLRGLMPIILSIRVNFVITRLLTSMRWCCCQEDRLNTMVQPNTELLDD